MEHYYPDIFKGIALKVKTGQWVPVSSTWVQMDENMPDGESLVRQFLYGQKYTQEKFGRYTRIAWQPDVFGHPYSMPQIARKAGIELYLFGRPRTPKRAPIIWWQGLDGSRVLGYSPPGWYTQPLDHDHITVMGIEAAQKLGIKNIMLLYGKGDHGGGPTQVDIEGIEKLNRSANDVRVRTTKVEDYLDLLLKEKKDFPVWDGEHNFVFRGCYTTQVEMKRDNRVAEQLLLDTEKMSELATFFHYRAYYPNRDISEAWKLTLHNQTHDLLAGSGIGPIYEDAAREYQDVFTRGRRALGLSLENIGRQLETGGEGVPVVVYNPQSWDRTDLVALEIAAPSIDERMVAIKGEEVVPVQLLARGARGGLLEHATVAFIAHSVPQMGLKLYRIMPASSAHPVPPSALQAGTEPRPYLENEYFRVEFNPATGNIARLYDKEQRREAFRGEGNFLVALEDTEEQSKKIQETGDERAGHAWDIGLTGKQWDLDKAARIDLTERGPARATFRIVRAFRNSEFVQNVSLLAGVPRVDVELSTDWRERNVFIKAGFPVNASASKVSAEIPYGAIEREQVGKEMVMGKWADISEVNFGVAVLNNGRHGYDAQDNVLRISVIRGPVYPDPRADEGFHTFGYAIYPHRSGWREGKVMQQALAFNSPLLAMQEPAHHRPRNFSTGELAGLPDDISFIRTDSDHVILYAMKQMEGFYDRDAILRFFECEGREGDVTIHLPFPVRASETNLLEETTGLVGEGQTIRFQMRPWEIKTLRLARQ
jgi:alpha-mannosidase